MTSLKFHLPFPPSINAMYPGDGKRRWKSKAYKAWEDEAAKMLMQQKRPDSPVEIPIKVKYFLGKPNNRKMDIANREKALSDFLVKNNIIKDDSLIHSLFMEWANIDGVDVEIEVI